MLHLKTLHVVFLMEGAQILERKLHEEDNLGDEDILWSGEQMFALGFRETSQFLIAGLPVGQKTHKRELSKGIVCLKLIYSASCPSKAI